MKRRRSARRPPVTAIVALAVLAVAVALVATRAIRTCRAETRSRDVATAPEPAAAPQGVRRDHEGNLLTATGDFAHANRLVMERSPYLQQHAHNPVDWHPWGDEAFRKAREENKPIFLSIGYSTCHWCHVMARESFSDVDVAALLNGYFVPVKVDREERPDVDDVYMTSVHVMGQRGGWPLSTWLTPELEPFDGGTYFPREAFLEHLEDIASAWSVRQEAVRAQARRVASAVQSRMAATRAAGEIGDDVLDGAVARLAIGHDATHGGWGVPKFPNETGILYLLDRWQRDGDRNAFDMALKALDAMQAGGIHDQVGGGFARYATDAGWLVPHFEKMLYNQAWLGRCYLEAWRLTANPRYRRTAEGILRYVTRDMTSPEGGFYSAEDADSEGEEGLFYLWTPAEMTTVLGGPEAGLAMTWFGVSAGGNFLERPGTSILTARHAPAAFAAQRGISERELLAKVDGWRSRLLETRARRVRPHRDEKVLTDWNGMMIGTFAMAARTLEEPSYRVAAERAAGFVLENLRDRDGNLLHVWAGGSAGVPGFLEDHAGLADGLVELHEATGQARWLEEAQRLHDTAREQFRDPADGAFARTGQRHQALLARAKDAYDGALPSGNALVAWNAVRLWRLSGDTTYRTDAEGIFRAFAAELRSARGAAFMLRAVEAWRHGALGPTARADSGVVAVRTPAHALAVAAGERVTVRVDLDVKDGWHVMAAPPVPQGLRATSVSVDVPFVLAGARFPSGRTLRLPFVEGDVRLYEGQVSIPLTLDVPAVVATGAAIARIAITTQACNDAKCLAPATLRLEVPLAVSRARAPGAPGG
jgi:hypothetical protein